MTKKTELATIPDSIVEIEKAIKKSDGLVYSASNFQETLRLGEMIRALKQYLNNDPNVKSIIQTFANNPLGFLTDKDPNKPAKQKDGSYSPPTPYPYNVISDCCVEAMLKGYRITGNEFNIISGRFYAAKNGKLRLINSNPAVSDFKHTLTTPQIQPGGREAKVRCFASWNFDGKKQTLGYEDQDNCTISVKVNNFMGTDGILGKVESKLFGRVLSRLSGRVIEEAEFQHENVVEAKTGSPLKSVSDIVEGTVEAEVIQKQAQTKPLQETLELWKSAIYELREEIKGIADKNQKDVFLIDLNSLAEEDTDEFENLQYNLREYQGRIEE